MSDDFDLKGYRENKLKITQAELASWLGVTQDYISKIENGNISVGLDFLLKFCNAVGDTPDGVLNFKLNNPGPLEIGDVYKEIKLKKKMLDLHVQPRIEKFNYDENNYGTALTKIDELYDIINIYGSKPLVAFLGPSDAGKSRLINILTGLDVLLAQWTPTTAATVYLKHIEDKPKWMGSDDVWVFKAESEEKGWDFRRYYDPDYCNQYKVFSGGLEILTKYCNRHTENLYKQVDSAVVYLESEILKACDIVDLPGFGTDNHRDTAQAQRAREKADVVVFLCQSNGFLNHENDLIFLKNVIQCLPPVNLSTNLPVLSNLMIVASQAHIVGESQVENLFRRGYTALDNQLNEGVIRSVFKISKPEFLSQLKNRFFSYSIESTNLRKDFVAELKRLLEEVLPVLRNKLLNNAIQEFINNTGELFADETKKFQLALNERETTKKIYEKKLQGKPRLYAQIQDGREKIIDLIEYLKKEDCQKLKTWEEKNITVKTIEKIIEDKKYTKKQAQQYLASNITDLYFVELQNIVSRSSEVFARESKKLFADIEKTSNEFNKLPMGQVDIPFDFKGAMAGGLAGATVLGGLSVMAASMGNLGGYILVAKGVSVLSAMGVSVGGTAAAASAVAALGGPITIGLALAATAYVLIQAFFGESWKTRLAKQVKEALTKEKVLENYSNEVVKFWDETKTAFLSLVDTIINKYEEHLLDLKVIIETYNEVELRDKVRKSWEMKHFFEEIPWDQS
ncbi:transcriptional regulator, XRE family [Desulforamulus reducens MI-1]|uniref:Transcriptional regulator, XRE family n=1 Tax=Desulforamulus reducens (strain ATCC BAA-1160 / DSM 100696 / MI-1) TaxID=349161 RepID=A4J1X0_DESRM|nr:dynamin family protein [Desulforamulus reducens]ABO49073.1 transcriptional regulator, XRE family [Desulforamulus reducens MI-1]